MELWEKTYLIYVNSSLIYWKFIIKVNNRLIWFLLRLKIDWGTSLSYTFFSSGENLQKHEILSIYFPGNLHEFQRYYLEKPYQCLFSKCFYILTDCSFMLEKFYIIFIVLQKTIAIKNAILHLNKIMLFLLR